MNNSEILKKRWKNVDKRLNVFLKKYNKLNKKTQDRIQQVFDSINFTADDVNKYINNNTKQRLKRQIEEFDENGILEGYFGYKVKAIMKKSKIKNIELLEILITGCYMLEMKEVNKIEKKLFQQTTEEIYEIGIKEAQPKKNKRKINFTIPDILLSIALSLPNSKGYIWNDYKEGNAEYNGSQILRQTIINMQQGKVLDVESYEFQKIFNSQNKRYLNKKKDQQQDDKYSGMLDEELTYLVNYTLLHAYHDAGIDKVRFIAVIDEHTTKMCESLNNQVFSITKVNRFTRYSESAGGEIVYRIKGLKVGINLPPINDHFHWCRSTIYPNE